MVRCTRFDLSALYEHFWPRVLKPSLPGHVTRQSSTGDRKGVRRLVVHAGLHKTGTTSLQIFLTGISAQLRQQNILYPRAGTPTWCPHGHHNIAWQLTRDRRFRSAFGTIDDLADEISQFGGDAIISSEDFESILDQPEQFAPLQNHPKLRQYEFVLLFYVRNQVSYLESLFLEMLKHGLGEEFVVFAQPLLGGGRLRIHDWVFQFDYERVYQACTIRQGMRVVIGDYHRLRGGSIITDFLNLACLDPVPDGANASTRANARAPLDYSLKCFYQNRVQRPLERREDELIQRLCERIGDRPVALSKGLAATLAAQFRRSNRAFCAMSRLPSEGLTACTRDVAEVVPLEHLFSFELQQFLAEEELDQLYSSSAFYSKLRLLHRKAPIRAR